MILTDNTGKWMTFDTVLRYLGFVEILSVEARPQFFINVPSCIANRFHEK